VKVESRLAEMDEDKKMGDDEPEDQLTNDREEQVIEPPLKV
jgi:hypothetical protein